MRYKAFATDYDGTMAHDGVVDEPTVEALRSARSAGMRLLMVTGRELPDLFNTFAHSDIFDLIVAENGAVVYNPATTTIEMLSPPPPPALVEALQNAQVPLSIGHAILATVAPHGDAVLHAIKELGLKWHVIFNKGAVMALPSSVTKATGLAVALKALGVTADETVGVGDAENDQAFLQACGLSVAVANALPSLKGQADIVTRGARGAGVQELIARLLSGELESISESASSV
jgi:hydroxymethylpyrimidine pyrophosphatase-like HAD family hydrolase